MLPVTFPLATYAVLPLKISPATAVASLVSDPPDSSMIVPSDFFTLSLMLSFSSARNAVTFPLGGVKLLTAELLSIFTSFGISFSPLSSKHCYGRSVRLFSF